MKRTCIALCIGCCLLPAAAPRKDSESAGVRRAIAWERYKDQAAARQAQMEKRHPSVMRQGEANREMETATPPANRVTDPGPREWRIHH
ncbi:MAG TPA: hypothetical protein VKX45_12470 [Bryobacteraceae bacterium]|jgi:hypothetical protein|nr:hypothetical protein [Bryobacteraceae bacterium]